MYFRGSRNGTDISVHVYITCPYSSRNAADCSSGSSQLLCSVGGFDSNSSEGHPVRGKYTVVEMYKGYTYSLHEQVDFIIDRRVK